MKFRLAMVVASAAAIAGCAALERVGVITDSGRSNDIGSTSPDLQRRSLVPLEDQLLVSGSLQGISFSLPAPAPVNEWPLPGGNPEQAMEHAAAAPNFRVAWTRDIGAATARDRFITAPPVSANGLIYTMDARARVTARSIQTGEEAWSVDLAPAGSGSRFSVPLPSVDIPFLRRERVHEDTSAYGGGLAVDGGHLYVTSGYRFITALDARTGQAVWRRDVRIPIHAAPTVGGGRVYAVNIDNELSTFDAASGEPGWQYQALVEPVRLLRASSPALTGETVIAAFSSGEVVAARTANGAEVWAGNLIRITRTTALSEIRDIGGRPVIYRGDLYAGSHSGAFAAVDIRTGTPRWQIPLVTMTTPWPAGDVIYAVSKYGQVICISRQSGLIYWITNLNNPDEPTRTERWFDFMRSAGRQPGQVYWSGPILASGRLISVSSSGYAAALNPNTGQVEGMIQLAGPALIEPIAAGGYVFVVTDNGKLVAIG